MKKIEVNQSTCIGCGACVQIARDAFKMNEKGLSVPIVEVVEGVTPEIIEAMEACPVNAITIEDDTK